MKAFFQVILTIWLAILFVTFSAEIIPDQNSSIPQPNYYSKSVLHRNPSKKNGKYPSISFETVSSNLYKIAVAGTGTAGAASSNVQATSTNIRVVMPG
jgi:hypothetical protein